MGALVDSTAVLIFGSQDDPHVKRVVGVLDQLGREHVNFDVHAEAFRPRLLLSLNDTESRRAAIKDTLSLDHIEAVWWRLKPPPIASHGMPFSEREWYLAVDSLASMLSQARWMNLRSVDQRLRHKALQLQAAAAAGFDTPPTLITNDPIAVLDFLESRGSAVVYKCLSYFHGGTDRALYTTALSADMVRQRARNIAAAPGIYQPMLEKRYELRITIVGTEIFAVRIDSQSRDDTQIDWRRNPLDVPYRAVHLPFQFARALVDFHLSQSLSFGAYDFVVTPEDRYIFLEVNSVGQWLWLEEEVGLEISKSVASFLHGDSGHHQK